MTDRREDEPSSLSDEDLLDELYRRFGAGWCSFSAAVRERAACPVCDRILPLTRHHLRPVAKGAGREVEIRRRYADICRDCHDIAHARWGPGHRWQGPVERELFLAEMIRLGTRTPAEGEDQPSRRRSKPRIRRFFRRLLSFKRFS